MRQTVLMTKRQQLLLALLAAFIGLLAVVAMDIVYTLLRDNGSAQDMWKRTGQAGRAFPRDFIEFVENIRLRVENETK